MRRKLISLILISAITCCMFSGCGSASQAQPDKTDEVKSETDEVKEASLKSENKSEEKTEEKSEEKAEEKSEEVPETVTGEKKDYEVSYAPVLNEVQKVVTSGYDYDKKYKYISDGLMEKCMYPGDGDLSEAVGYVLEDISGDDIPELIIGSDEEYGDYPKQSYIFSVFSLQNDKPIKVFDGWARSSYRWIGDDHFYYCGSGGAAITLFGKNHLSKDGLEIVWDDFYFSDEKITYCENEYRSHGLPCIFKITDADRGLADKLLKRGYFITAPTDLMILKLDEYQSDNLEEVLKNVIFSTEPDAWYEPYFEFEGPKDAKNQELCKRIN